MDPHTVNNLSEPLPTSLNFATQTGVANGGDWQEEAYQKLKTMKELYFPDLNEMYIKVAGKLNQHESLPQQPGPDQLGKVRQLKVMLERLMSYLQVSKSNVTLPLKEKIGTIEKQIISLLNSNRPTKPDPLQQQQLSSLDIVGGVGGGGVDVPNWRAGLLLQSRHRIVDKILETLKKHLPFSSHEELNELKKIAVRFEEKIYTAASSQSDYLRKISSKMLAMENKNQPNGNPPPDQASQSMQSGIDEENDSSESTIVNGDACRSLAASIQALSNEMNANFAMLHGSVARLQKDVDSLQAHLPGRGDDSM